MVVSRYRVPIASLITLVSMHTAIKPCAHSAALRKTATATHTPATTRKHRVREKDWKDRVRETGNKGERGFQMAIVGKCIVVEVH